MSTYTISARRQTKYCQSIEVVLANIGHATNAQLLDVLQKTYADLSATTVHRATARLAARGTIGIAPTNKGGSTQYDTNITPHDHFQCLVCGLLKDTNIKDKVIPILEASIDGCSISGQLTISGICKKCTNKEKSHETTK